MAPILRSSRGEVARRALRAQQRVGKLGGQRGAGEQVSLDVIAAARAQELELRFGLHALGRDAQPEQVPQLDMRAPAGTAMIKRLEQSIDAAYKDAAMPHDARILIRDLLSVSLRVRKRVRRGLIERGHDLHPAQTAVIPNLPADGLRLTDLALRLGVSVQRAGQLVQALDSSGYVEREVDPSDARAKRVRYSARGRKLLRDADELHAELWQELAQRLGRRELESFAKTLAALRQEWIGADAPMLLEVPARKRSTRRLARRRP